MPLFIAFPYSKRSLLGGSQGPGAGAAGWLRFHSLYLLYPQYTVSGLAHALALVRQTHRGYFPGVTKPVPCATSCVPRVHNLTWTYLACHLVSECSTFYHCNPETHLVRLSGNRLPPCASGGISEPVGMRLCMSYTLPSRMISLHAALGTGACLPSLECFKREFVLFFSSSSLNSLSWFQLVDHYVIRFKLISRSLGH